MSVHDDSVPEAVVTVESSRVTPPVPAAAPDGLAFPPEDALELERARRFDDPVAVDPPDDDAFDEDAFDEDVLERPEAFDVLDEELRRFDPEDDRSSLPLDPLRELRPDRPLESSVDRDDRRFDRDPVDEPDREERESECPVLPERPDEAVPVDALLLALAPLPPALADPLSSVRHALGSGMPEVRFAT